MMESSIRECKSRGAKIILITDNEGTLLDFADVVLQTPKSGSETSAILNTIPLQLMAYYLAKTKGLNADRPRNLAKSVTVI
jgi:glucosamine--fructose-6-phosphate aminotransferase (isomerizing)